MEGFKKVNGQQIDSIENYVKEYVDTHENVNIIVGTDSNDKGDRWKIVTVVAFENPGHGVHYVYKKDNRKIKPNNIKEKIFEETSLSLELANKLDELLHDLNFKSDKLENERYVKIHCDVNGNNEFESNKAYSEVVGWVKGCGYSIETKPSSWAASTAADARVKH